VCIHAIEKRLMFFFIWGVFITIVFILLDRLIKWEYIHYYIYWKTDGQPTGILWSIQKHIHSKKDHYSYEEFDAMRKDPNWEYKSIIEIQKQRLAMRKIMIDWLLNTPEWVKTDIHARLLLYCYRIFFFLSLFYWPLLSYLPDIININ
jgi:hypothetical protein